MNNKFYNDDTFTFFGDGKQTRDFVYVKDLVQAVSIVINNEETNGKILNLGTGKQLSLVQMFSEFEKLYNKTIPYDFSKPRNGDIKHSYAQIDDLNNLGYLAKYNVQEGLKEYIKYTNSI